MCKLFINYVLVMALAMFVYLGGSVKFGSNQAAYVTAIVALTIVYAVPRRSLAAVFDEDVRERRLRFSLLAAGIMFAYCLALMFRSDIALAPLGAAMVTAVAAMTLVALGVLNGLSSFSLPRGQFIAILMLTMLTCFIAPPVVFVGLLDWLMAVFSSPTWSYLGVTTLVAVISIPMVWNVVPDGAKAWPAYLAKVLLWLGGFNLGLFIIILYEWSKPGTPVTWLIAVLSWAPVLMSLVFAWVGAAFEEKEGERVTNYLIGLIITAAVCFFWWLHGFLSIGLSLLMATTVTLSLMVIVLAVGLANGLHSKTPPIRVPRSFPVLILANAATCMAVGFVPAWYSQPWLAAIGVLMMYLAVIFGGIVWVKVSAQGHETVPG